MIEYECSNFALPNENFRALGFFRDKRDLESSRVCSATVEVSNLPSFKRVVRGRRLKNPRNGSKTTQKPKIDDNEQLKYGFLQTSFFKPGEWLTCAATSVKDAILFPDAIVEKVESEKADTCKRQSMAESLDY